MPTLTPFLTATQLQNLVRSRHACKAFDAEKKISAEQWAALADVLRFSPSSVNSQGWHFTVASSAAGKEKIAEATRPASEYNAPKILNASHVVVLSVRTQLDEAHLRRLLDQEAADARFADEAAKKGQENGRRFYFGLHEQKRDTAHWQQRQAYIALGNLLLAAASLGLDACPIEGFDNERLDAILDLPARGLQSVVIAALGVRSANDANARLPKSRLPLAAVMTEI